MGAYRISFTISAAPAITNYFIAVLYKTTAPASEVTRILLGNNHTAPQNCAFNDIDGGIYLVKVHESVDNSTLGNLRHDFEVNAWINRILNERRFYHVDGGGTYDPLDGSTNITDPYFEGKSVSGLFQEGYRFLIPTVEWRQDAGGVITYLNDINSGVQISNYTNQVWMVEITYTVTAPDASDTDDSFTEIINVTANITLTGTQYGKVIAVAGATSNQTTTLPLISPAIEKRGYEVLHDGGSAINVKVTAQSGEIIRFRGADVNSILLAKGEFVKLVKKGAKWWVIDCKGQWDRIGEQVASDVVLPNSLIFDGSSYDGNVYLRLYDFVANTVPVAQKIPPASWTANAFLQGLYAIDTSTKQVIVPDRRGYSTRFLINIGSTDTDRTNNVPGGKQQGQVGAFDGNVTIPIASTSKTDVGFGRVATGSDGNEPSDTIVNMKFQTGKENTVKNIGALPLMLI
jgi:hypothetical protein